MEEMQTFFNANKENFKRLLVTERIKTGYGALFIHIQRNKDDTPKQIKTYWEDYGRTAAKRSSREMV